MAMEIISPSAQIASVMHEIESGMSLNKCLKCGCMLDALHNVHVAFNASAEAEIRALLPAIEEHKAKMLPIAYDCYGCQKCWGADATIQLVENFENVLPEGNGCSACTTDAAVVRSKHANGRAWPPYPGDYVVGTPTGPVAVCTLSNRDLALPVVEGGQSHVAIAGRCDTENIGVEKVVLNILANPNIRWLILCGVEAEGHRAGDAFLQLKEKGVDANMRVLDSASWRPVLANLTLLDVALFRQQVEIVNLAGTVDAAAILSAVSECAAQMLPPLEAGHSDAPALDCEWIDAYAPERLELDRAGFFIILPQRETGVILCEHYENNGRLTHVIEGRNAAFIASTVVARGLITRLDHAAYLGRELARAEIALKTGLEYEQDSALGALASATADENAGECGAGSCCDG